METCESDATAIGTGGVSTFRVRLWLFLNIILATALRLFRLGEKSFWLDEAISAVLARVDRHVFILAIFHRQANMTLYYLLLRGWTWLGSNEFVVRSLSVVAGVAAIPAIYVLGARLFGSRAGRLAALLLSVHAFHIRYSQEARAYSLTMLLAIVSSLFFVRAVERPSHKNWAGYIVTSTLLVYAQVFGGWVLLAHGVSLLLARRKVSWRQFALSAAAICFLISPLAYCLFLVSDRSQLAWLAAPSLQDLYKFGLDMTGDAGWLVLLAYVVFLLVAVKALVMRPQPVTAETWKYWFALLWLLLPIALVLAISLHWSAFEPRFLIVCLPPLILLAADALSQIHGGVLFSATLMILLGLSLNGTYSYHRARADAQHTDDWRDATRYVLSHAEAGDAVLFSYSEEKLAFDEYQWLLRAAGSPLHEFPEETEFDLLTRRPSRPGRELLDDIATRYSRLWVLTAYQPNRASRDVDAVLRSHFNERSDQNFGFVHADLLAGGIVGSLDHLERCP
jgi:mannosyltransferase